MLNVSVLQFHCSRGRRSVAAVVTYIDCQARHSTNTVPLGQLLNWGLLSHEVACLSNSHRSNVLLYCGATFPTVWNNWR